MAHEQRNEGEPFDRLTRMAERMVNGLEADPEYARADIRAIVFIDSDVERRGGLVLHGYDDDSDAMAAILSHVKAVFATHGVELDLEFRE